MTLFTEFAFGEKVYIDEIGGTSSTVAKELAKYQSPTFRAIAVVAPQGGNEKGPPTISADNVITIKDAQALSRVYQNMVRQVR